MSSELIKDGAGLIDPEFPHLGPQQPMPTTATPMDDMLLQVLILHTRFCVRSNSRCLRVAKK